MKERERLFKLIVFLLLIMILCLALGCGRKEDNKLHQAKTYGSDGYLGISNSNPNLWSSPAYRTYRQDSDMMRQALQNIPGIQNIRIHIKGATAAVKLHLDPSLDADHADEVRESAYRMLIEAMPRYTFRVS